MFPLLLPLRAILFQLLFLFLAIAIEAFILQQLLQLSRKSSVQYSTCLNLITTTLGWIIFFNTEKFLPARWQEQMISYVFFDRFFANDLLSSMNAILILAGVLTFFGTFLLEWKGLELLENLKTFQFPSKANPAPPRATRPSHLHESARMVYRIPMAVLVANACSYSSIILLLLIRLLQTKAIG